MPIGEQIVSFLGAPVAANSTHMVIEQRHAHFERVRHGSDVDFRQNVAGQIGFEVEVLERRQSIDRSRPPRTGWPIRP